MSQIHKEVASTSEVQIRRNGCNEEQADQATRKKLSAIPWVRTFREERLARFKWDKPFPVRIVSLESIRDEIPRDATILWMNRESSPSQESNHAPKFDALKKAYTRLHIESPFVENKYTGRGYITTIRKYLVDFEFDIEYAPHIDPGYFGWFADEIRKGLRQTPPGKMLYVVFCTKSRMIRPMGHKNRNAQTWDYTADDREIFSRWLHLHFGSQVQNITFVLLHEGSPASDRGYESRLSMVYYNRWGGRPRRTPNTPEKRRRFIRKLRNESIELATECNMNAGNILDHHTNKYRQVPIKLRRIQLWLAEEGVSTSSGRPIGTTKKQN